MKKPLIIILISALLLLFSGAAIDYIGVGGSIVTINIPQGSGASQIAKTLKEKKVISFSSLFLIYLGDDAENLKAGVHVFTTHMGYHKTLEELKKDVPLENSITITIPEGYELREICDLLENTGLVTKESFTDACNSAYKNHTFLRDDGNVEGFLFPATYTFQIGVSAEEIINEMLDTFSEKMLTNENVTRAEELGMTFHEALTLASIIEREAAKSDERPTVSSVFHNRISQNMHLESCATVQYILKERKPVLQIADTKINSPYNTYMYPGLPPAPIASPGEASMRAALYPNETEYLFFVSDGYGGHIFSKTYAEHLSAVNNDKKNPLVFREDFFIVQ